ncbi:hypothetical protein GCM10023187_17220 [Nibrella viscosa]|uniref:VWFA domain-containing protein n=1 Tax=Nibrella viscosa TaxID=1084524 RepID=A0ABP8K9E1_9BACT
MMNQSIRNLSKSWLFLLVLGLLFGCGGSDRGENSGRKARTTKDKTAPAAAPAATLNEIHFFMETSASMNGYLKGGTEFKDVVSEVVTKANTIKPVTVYTISEQPQLYKGNPAKFVQDLATTPLASGRSSKLHTIFEQVAKKAGNNSIAILVTDAILSFPDQEIRRNPDINRTDASSVLKNNIYDEFVRMNRQGIGATVYAYRSAYNGTYYDYQNAKQTLNGETRPFYIWVIGKQELLNDFNERMQEMLTNQPAKTLSFGTGSALKKYDLFFSLNKKGDWRAKNGNITELKTKGGAPAEFAVGLDLNGLPAYAQTEDYIRKNLVVTAKDASVKLANVQKKEAVTNTSRLSEREQRLLNQSTHVLTFRVDNVFGDEANVAARLPVKFDNWPEQWSTMDDRTATGRQNKTFALQHLMNGVKEAYQSATNDFLQLTFKIEK